jgi:hypothetical protein
MCHKYVMLQVQEALPSIMLHVGAMLSVVWYFSIYALEFPPLLLAGILHTYHFA